jgi:hypothetical protein
LIAYAPRLFESRVTEVLECRDLSPLWYEAALRLLETKRGPFHSGRDKSRPAKAVTSYRTPYLAARSMYPRLWNCFSSFEIIDHQDQLMIVIAVKSDFPAQ